MVNNPWLSTTCTGVELPLHFRLVKDICCCINCEQIENVSQNSTVFFLSLSLSPLTLPFFSVIFLNAPFCATALCGAVLWQVNQDSHIRKHWNQRRKPDIIFKVFQRPSSFQFSTWPPLPIAPDFMRSVMKSLLMSRIGILLVKQWK